MNFNELENFLFIYFTLHLQQKVQKKLTIGYDSKSSGKNIIVIHVVYKQKLNYSQFNGLQYHNIVEVIIED